MSRLRYPFAEIGLRCRLCNTLEYIDTGGGRVGTRLIAWRRQHAQVCPKWNQWATRKGLTLDEHGALLYPGEVGPFVPRSRVPLVTEAEPEKDDLLEMSDEAFGQGGLF